MEVTIFSERFTGTCTCGCCGPIAGKTEHAGPASAEEERNTTIKQVSQLSTKAKETSSACDCGCETTGCDCGCECCEV